MHGDPWSVSTCSNSYDYSLLSSPVRCVLTIERKGWREGRREGGRERERRGGERERGFAVYTSRRQRPHLRKFVFFLELKRTSNWNLIVSSLWELWREEKEGGKEGSEEGRRYLKGGREGEMEGGREGSWEEERDGGWLLVYIFRIILNLFLSWLPQQQRVNGIVTLKCNGRIGI